MIFKEFAPYYWAAGLPAIPLRQRNKMPDLTGWSAFASRMPSASEMDHWLASFPNGNIGLPLGPQSGVCVVDIDTEDETLVETILKCLPKSPWERVGKKGMALAYKFENQRNFKLRGEGGGMILEFLGLGNQVVLPPSIHPDTGLPYTSNTNLWEVLEDLPELGEDIEDRLRSLLGKAGVGLGAGGRSSPIDVVPSGERDVQMVRHAGYLARVVLGIDKTVQFPLYEAIQQMYAWVEGYTRKVSGDSMDPNKGVAKLLEFLLKDLEKGRTMPEGWDGGMPDEWREHATIRRMVDLNTAQRWSLTRAREWLAGKIAENPENDDWCMARVQELVWEVAKDDQFTDFEFRSLITFILGICGKDLGLKKSDLLIAFKDARKGGTGEGEAENHYAIAREVLEQMQRSGEIRYDHGQFWQWGGSCFHALSSDDIYRYIAENVDSVLARTHNGYGQVVQVMEKICSFDLIQSEERGLNFANGFVGEDLRVLEHDPKYGATFTLPFEYDRDRASRCPRFMAFLHDCWGEEPDFGDRVKALQESFAATMFRIAPRYQRAFLLFGKAGTGKTQLLNMLRSLLPPDAISDLGPDKWNERFGMTDLIGKAANICGELPENGRIAGAVFKQVVEGSPIRTEFKNQDGFVFMPECAHWFASNFLPWSGDTSRGFIRRWLILDFNRVVEVEKRVENLAESVVAEERDAIAAWSLEGLRRLLDQRGYTEPACHHFRLGSMRRTNNSVHAFLEDTGVLRRKEGGEMRAREVYDQYSFHMRDLGGRVTPVGFERFIQMTEDLDLGVEQRSDPIGHKDYWIRGISRL